MKIKKNKIFTVIIILGFLALWEILARNNLINKTYTSSPFEIAKDIYNFYKSGDLVKNVKITLSEAFLGLIIGTLIGIIMAMMLSYFKELGKSLEPIITMLHSIPQLALAPIYIMWFGIGMTSKVFISSVMVFFLVFFSTFSGIKSMESRLEESAKMLGATDFEIMFKVTLPTSVPWIVSGIRGGLGAALIGAIVGEYLGASSGIGWMISAATSYYNMTRVMTMLFILLVIGGTLNYVLKLAENRLMKYKIR